MSKWSYVKDLKRVCSTGDIDKVLAFIEECMKDAELNLLIEFDYVGEYGFWNHGLYGACKSGNAELVNLMIEKGAYNWNWGLSGAYKTKQLHIVNMMIKKGASDHL